MSSDKTKEGMGAQWVDVSKHTPGPWRFYTEPQPNGCPIVGARGLMVAMLAHTVNQPEQREIALANARLISSAPMLLAELEAIANADPSKWDEEVRDQFREWAQNRARAALSTIRSTP